MADVRRHGCQLYQEQLLHSVSLKGSRTFPAVVGLASACPVCDADGQRPITVAQHPHQPATTTTAGQPHTDRRERETKQEEERSRRRESCSRSLALSLSLVRLSVTILSRSLSAVVSSMLSRTRTHHQSIHLSREERTERI
jgi:hypothetical protein